MPERVSSVLAELESAGYDVEDVSGESLPTVAAHEAVLAVHDERYVKRFERAVERGDGLLDSADNPLSKGTWISSWAAVHATLKATDWMIEGAGRKALAAVRPPGHHAEASMAMGFCYFNNVAAAAAHLQAEHGLKRVAIFDFDVHHGNGTQHIFEERADVLYASTHQFPFYPGTGAASETGIDAGKGATVNVPLPAGTGDSGFGDAIRHDILPPIRAFAPDALLISAGFDAWAEDPLGGMQVSLDGHYDWGEQLAEIADEICDGRILEVLEGGYDIIRRPDVVRRHLEGLLGAAI